jgi:hypothetical protein
MFLRLNCFSSGSSLLLVNSSESSDCEDHESDYLHHHHQAGLEKTRVFSKNLAQQVFFGFLVFLGFF